MSLACRAVWGRRWSAREDALEIRAHCQSYKGLEIEAALFSREEMILAEHIDEDSTVVWFTKCVQRNCEFGGAFQDLAVGNGHGGPGPKGGQTLLCG